MIFHYIPPFSLYFPKIFHILMVQIHISEMLWTERRSSEGPPSALLFGRFGGVFLIVNFLRKTSPSGRV